MELYSRWHMMRIFLLLQVNGTKKNRIHYSGPLMPPGVNMDEILREHERQIQQAVRRARLDKGKGKHNGERDQSEALLYTTGNIRADRWMVWLGLVWIPVWATIKCIENGVGSLLFFCPSSREVFCFARNFTPDVVWYPGGSCERKPVHVEIYRPSLA